MRAYNLLLHLYPASFRNEYGEEMRALFARRRRDAAGSPALVGLWLATVGEVAANAFLVHLDLLRQDLGYTLRMVRRTPGFSAVVVLTLAVGIGINAVAFTAVNALTSTPPGSVTV